MSRFNFILEPMLNILNIAAGVSIGTFIGVATSDHFIHRNTNETRIEQPVDITKCYQESVEKK